MLASQRPFSFDPFVGITARRKHIDPVHLLISALMCLTLQWWDLHFRNCNVGLWLLKPHPKPSFTDPSEEMMRSLLQGYDPIFKPHRLGREAKSLLLLSPSQRMCYHDGKLFGGYVAFLLDRILADCCQPPNRGFADGCGPVVTANFNASFLLPVSPTVPILLRAWPHKVEGRKIFLKGSVQIPGKPSNEWIDAIQAEALFIRAKVWRSVRIRSMRTFLVDVTWVGILLSFEIFLEYQILIIYQSFCQCNARMSWRIWCARFVKLDSTTVSCSRFDASAEWKEGYSRACMACK